MRPFFLLFVMSGVVSFWSCAGDNTAGGTVETENTVAAQVHDSLGRIQAGLAVHIRPLWYLSDTLPMSGRAELVDSLANSAGIRDLVTDKNGWILCDSLPMGTYRLEVGNDSMAVAIEFDHMDTTSIQHLGNLVLQATGSLEGSISLPAGVHSAWVQIYGSDHRVRTDSLGSFGLLGIPVGIVRILASAASEPSLLAEDLAQIRPGRTSLMGQVPLPTVENEDPLTWRYSMDLRIDTLVRDWMLPLADMTMLTFRLESPAFDFSQAMADGRDLRITDALGYPLRFERVRWDSAKGKAVVRVQVPTQNLDSATLVQLRWGRPGAIDPDTSGLWLGVPDSVHQYLTRLVVGDFEKATSQTDLPVFLPHTWWYVRKSDSAVTMTPEPYTNFLPALQDAAPGRSGMAAHITYSADLSHWVLLGTTLSSGPRSLATLDSVVFYAKGDGILSLAFDNLAGEGNKAWVHMDLDSLWTRYRVRPQDLLPGTPGTEVRDWSEIEDSVTNLTFFAGGGSFFWIDSVTLYGVGVEDLR